MATVMKAAHCSVTPCHSCTKVLNECSLDKDVALIRGRGWNKRTDVC